MKRWLGPVALGVSLCSLAGVLYYGSLTREYNRQTRELLLEAARYQEKARTIQEQVKWEKILNK